MNFSQPYQPSRRVQLEIPTEFTEPTVRVWLAELPVADADRTGDILLHGLRVLGRTAGLSVKARLALLEILRSASLPLVLQEAASAEQADAAFPLRQLQNQRAHRAYSICVELAVSYGSLVLGAGQVEKLASGPGLSPLALHRALDAYGLAMQLLLENYQPTPPGFWTQVYDVYRHAVQVRLDLDIVPGETSCVTVFAQFMRIVLLSIANLYRSRPRETRQVYAILGEVADKAELCDTPVRDDQKAQFFLDLAVDAAPQTLVSLKGHGPVERRFVMTQLLVKWAAKHYADAGNRSVGDLRIGKSVLTALLKSLALPERRRTKRLLESGEHHIHLGIAAIKNRLEGRRASVAVPTEASEHVFFKGAGWLKVPNYTMEDIEVAEEGGSRAEERMSRDDRQVGWQLGTTTSVVRGDEIWSTQKADQTAGTLADYAPQLDVWLLNSSATGYCLLWSDAEVSGARVGELVGIDGADDSLHLGVIRWLNHNEKGDLMMGVELISPQVEGGEIWPVNKPTVSRRALYVQANARLSQPARLLTLPASFDVGLVVEWKGQRASRILKLEQVQSSTPAYVEYVVSASPRGGLTAIN